MDERQRGGDAGDSGESSVRVPTPSPHIPEDFTPQQHYTARELDSIAIKYFKNRNVPLDFLHTFPPKAKAYLIRTPQFQDYVDSLLFDAATGNEKITKGQISVLKLLRKPPSKFEKREKKVKPSPIASFDVSPSNEDEKPGA